MKAEKVEILGCQVHRVDMGQAINIIAAMLGQEECQQVITLNAEIIYMALQDPELKAVINQAALVTPDGSGVVWASRQLGNPLLERVTGIDLAYRLAAAGASRGWSFYFLGARPGIAEEAARRLKEQYPGLKVVGCQHGYFTGEEEDQVLAEIDRAQPDILLVALGAPRQDLWIARHREHLGCRVAIGVGGSFDVMAGVLERAPGWIIGMNLEWLYRLLKEPARWRRQKVLPLFAWRVLREKRSRLTP